MEKIFNHLDSNKMFFVKRSKLENKLEVSYHLPEISHLEKKVREKSSKVLNDYIVKIASGATPSVNEEQKFYATSIDGIPFLRVQNLQTNGLLNLSDVKFINRTTHEGYLKRSQVAEGDLLIKITGVGRMAVASVAPSGFEGNTNQHMVVVKTKDRQTSKYLANYLNLDFVEKLASRRATGGTRPALDYQALKSIPIIDGIDFSVLRKAEIAKQGKELQARALIESVDIFLLNELGVKLPEKDSSLQGRIFVTKFSEVCSGRLDPKLYDKRTTGLQSAISNIDLKRFALIPLRDLLVESIPGDWGEDDKHDEVQGYTRCLVIRATEFENDYNLRLETARAKYRLIKNDKLSKLNLKVGDLLIEKSGGSPDQPVGRIALITAELLQNKTLAFSNFIHKIAVDTSRVDPTYLFCYLKTLHNIKLTEAMQSQTNGIRNLIMNSYLNQKVVLPINRKGVSDLKKQKDIAAHLQNLRFQAKSLQKDAVNVLTIAKKQIEKSLFKND